VTCGLKTSVRWVLKVCVLSRSSMAHELSRFLRGEDDGLYFRAILVALHSEPFCDVREINSWRMIRF
jgi:hypothetical protein